MIIRRMNSEAFFTSDNHGVFTSDLFSEFYMKIVKDTMWKEFYYVIW